MQLNHGKPAPTGFVLIAMPNNGERIGDRVQTPPLRVVLKNPKSGEESQAEIHDIWQFNFNDEKEHQLITAWAKLAYGITGPQLMNSLYKRYPDMGNKVEFILLKQL